MAINRPGALTHALTAAAADGTVTDGEVASVIRLAARNTVTRDEARALLKTLGTLGDSFQAVAKLDLSRFAQGALTPADTADPKVMHHDAGTLRYRPALGGLYKDGVSPRDVVQGHAGDCYFLSTLASVAKQRPGLIKDAITRKADGSYLVRFFKPGPGGTSQPVYVPVDKELPRDRWGHAHYAHSAQRENWVALMEKAYAKFKGSYEAIGNGGAPSDVMTALTGKPASYQPTSGDGAPADTFGLMQQTLRQHGLLVAATRADGRYTGTGVVPSHAYTVLGVSGQGGARTVTLRNPWGRTEPGAPRSGDGVFTLSYARFLELFPDLFFTAPPGAPAAS